MQGPYPLDWQIRLRLNVVAHDSWQTRKLDALGRCQRPFDFFVDQRKPPLVQRVAPGDPNRPPFDCDSTEQFHDRLQLHAGVEIRPQNRPGCRQLQFGIVCARRQITTGVEEVQLKMLDKLPNPEVRVRLAFWDTGCSDSCDLVVVTEWPSVPDGSRE